MNNSDISRFGSILQRHIISLSVIIAVFTFFASPISAQDSATIYIDVIKNTAPQPVDTIFANGHYEFRIWGALSFISGGVSFPFKISSPDGLIWSYIAMPDGHGEGSHLPGYGCACITIAPGSNMNESTLDMTGLVVNEYNLDGADTDSIQVGGVGMSGIPPCDLEHWLSLHFSAAPLPPYDVHTICIDSIHEAIPSNMRFVFRDAIGDVLIPNFEGPFCWPVTYCCDIPGDVNQDGAFGVGDAVYMIAWIFRGAPAPICYDEGNVNGDEWADIGDAVYMINYIFHGGSPLTCP